MFKVARGPHCDKSDSSFPFSCTVNFLDLSNKRSTSHDSDETGRFSHVRCSSPRGTLAVRPQNQRHGHVGSKVNELSELRLPCSLYLKDCANLFVLSKPVQLLIQCDCTERTVRKVETRAASLLDATRNHLRVRTAASSHEFACQRFAPYSPCTSTVLNGINAPAQPT